MHTFIYLHGFASSPRSAKAVYLQHQFQSIGQSLILPDLNQGDFFHLTLPRQIQQVEALLPEKDSPVTLIGSSFGGLTAAWIGERCPQVDRLVLLAPAFRFLDHWLPRLGEEQVQRWQSEGFLMAYHYGEQQMMPIGYDLVSTMAAYDEATLRRPVPTLLLHGRNDDVIPISASREFAAVRAWVRLVELESDHTLSNKQAEIWQAIQAFCQLVPEI